MRKIVISYMDRHVEEFTDENYYWTVDYQTRIVYVVRRDVLGKEKIIDKIVVRIPFENIKKIEETMVGSENE